MPKIGGTERSLALAVMMLHLLKNSLDFLWRNPASHLLKEAFNVVRFRVFAQHDLMAAAELRRIKQRTSLRRAAVAL